MRKRVMHSFPTIAAKSTHLQHVREDTLLLPVNPTWLLSVPTRQFSKWRAISQKRPIRRSYLGLPILDPLGVWASAWGYITTCFDLTFTAFIVPVLLAFNGYSTGTSRPLVVLDLVGNAFYILDFIINFHVGLLVRCGMDSVLITDGPTSALHYVRSGTFVVDLFATLPALGQLIGYAIVGADVENKTVVMVMSLFKLARLLRVATLVLRLGSVQKGGLIAQVAASRMNPLTMLMFNALLSLVICLHVLACLWWWVAEVEGLESSWVAGVDKPFIRLIPENSNTSELSVSLNRWTLSAYFVMVTMSTIGYGDITPQTIPEIFIIAGIVLIGVAWFAYLISTISMVLKSRKKDVNEDMMVARLQAMENWMRRYEFPNRLKHRVRKHLMSTWTPAPTYDDAEFYDQLPGYLKVGVARQMQAGDMLEALVGGKLGKMSVSKTEWDALASAVAELSVLLNVEEQCVLHSGGDAAADFLLLQDGQVAVNVPGSRLPVIVTAPAILGLGALFESFPQVPQCRQRVTTVTTLSHCKLWKIDADAFENRMMRRGPSALLAILRCYRRQVASSIDKLTDLAASVEAKRTSLQQRHPGCPAFLEGMEGLKAGLEEVEAQMIREIAGMRELEDVLPTSNSDTSIAAARASAAAVGTNEAHDNVLPSRGRDEQQPRGSGRSSITNNLSRRRSNTESSSNADGDEGSGDDDGSIGVLGSELPTEHDPKAADHSNTTARMSMMQSTNFDNHHGSFSLFSTTMRALELCEAGQRNPARDSRTVELRSTSAAVASLSKDGVMYAL